MPTLFEAIHCQSTCFLAEATWTIHPYGCSTKALFFSPNNIPRNLMTCLLVPKITHLFFFFSQMVPYVNILPTGTSEIILLTLKKSFSSEVAWICSQATCVTREQFLILGFLEYVPGFRPGSNHDSLHLQSPPVLLNFISLISFILLL